MFPREKHPVLRVEDAEGAPETGMRTGPVGNRSAPSESGVFPIGNIGLRVHTPHRCVGLSTSLEFGGTAPTAAASM
jgi:hypothetical protein